MWLVSVMSLSRFGIPRVFQLLYYCMYCATFAYSPVDEHTIHIQLGLPSLEMTHDGKLATGRAENAGILKAGCTDRDRKQETLKSTLCASVRSQR